jgi:hypothetical protein
MLNKTGGTTSLKPVLVFILNPQLLVEDLERFYRGYSLFIRNMSLLSYEPRTPSH